MREQTEQPTENHTPVEEHHYTEIFPDLCSAVSSGYLYPVTQTAFGQPDSNSQKESGNSVYAEPYELW